MFVNKFHFKLQENGKLPKLKKKKKRRKNESKPKELPNFETYSGGKIPSYNSLLDPHLVNYFANPNVEYVLSFQSDKSKGPKKYLKKHSYKNVVHPGKKREVKSVLEFIERANDEVRPPPKKYKFLQKNDKKKRKKSNILKLPIYVRTKILSYLKVKKCLEFVQMFQCHRSQDSWKTFLDTYYHPLTYTSRDYYLQFKGYYRMRKKANKYYFAVRVRPFILGEMDRQVITLRDDTLTVTHPSTHRKDMFKGFDDIFWSFDQNHEYASQESIFKAVGSSVLSSLWIGLNATVFAYGSYSSGKSFNLMGGDTQPGIIPRTCRAIFDAMDMNMNPYVKFTITVSMIEFRNGKMSDLFNAERKELLLVSDPLHGAYVDGIKVLQVKNWDEMHQILEIIRDENLKCKASQSRHTLFQLHLLQERSKYVGYQTPRVERTKQATLSIVDLGASRPTDGHDEYGIGHSLTTLHHVLMLMRKNERKQRQAKSPHKHSLPSPNRIPIPFRMSNLTYILQSVLEKRSRIFFLGSLSPAQYNDSVSTLKYISHLTSDGKKTNHKVILPRPRTQPGKIKKAMPPSFVVDNHPLRAPTKARPLPPIQRRMSYTPNRK